jgi:hypothetical protein
MCGPMLRARKQWNVQWEARCHLDRGLQRVLCLLFQQHSTCKPHLHANSGLIDRRSEEVPRASMKRGEQAATDGGRIRRVENGRLRSKAGLESTRMWEASLENAKQPPFGICDIRSIWLQVPSFPRARPRMCRREDWVAADSVQSRFWPLQKKSGFSRI